MTQSKKQSQERSKWLCELDDYILERHVDIYEGWHEQEGIAGDIDEYLEIFYPEQVQEILQEFEKQRKK